MRRNLVRLGMALAFGTAALGLLIVIVSGIPLAKAAGAATSDIGQTRFAGAEQVWNAPLQAGPLVAVSERMAPINARRTISDPGLNTPLTLGAVGRRITVTGHVGCVKGDEYKVQTSVTQRSSGALARGETTGACTGKEEQFSATTWAYDEALFTAGPAQVCALLTIRTKGKAADAFQWCRKEDASLTTVATY